MSAEVTVSLCLPGMVREAYHPRLCRIIFPGPGCTELDFRTDYIEDNKPKTSTSTYKVACIKDSVQRGFGTLGA